MIDRSILNYIHYNVNFEPLTNVVRLIMQHIMERYLVQKYQLTSLQIDAIIHDSLCQLIAFVS